KVLVESGQHNRRSRKQGADDVPSLIAGQMRFVPGDLPFQWMVGINVEIYGAICCFLRVESHGVRSRWFPFYHGKCAVVDLLEGVLKTATHCELEDRIDE